MYTRRPSTILALILLVFTLAYGVFQARILIHGPILTITSPQPGSTVSGVVMEIAGATENVTRLTINGQPVTMDVSGTFTEKRITPDGYGTILVEAQDRFGHTTQQQFTFLGAPSTGSS